MPKGSKSSGNSTSITVINIGHISSVPMKTTVTIKESKGRYQNKTGISYGDKPEGSKKSGKYASKKSLANIGRVSGVPVRNAVTIKGEGSYRTKSCISRCDKQSGSYKKDTTKKKASAGAFQLKNGTTGTKSECKKSSSIRFGDKNGYTEVYKEERVRQVRYNKSSGSKKPRTSITCNFGDGGAYDGMLRTASSSGGGGGGGAYVYDGMSLTSSSSGMLFW